MLTQEDLAGDRIPKADSARPIRVAFVCNHSFGAVTLYRGLFPYLRAQGIESEVIVGDDAYLATNGDFKDVPVHVVRMEREPAPLRDIATLVRLTRFLAANRYDVVHVSTPKAAFLGAIAARLTGHRALLFVVRTRIYEYKRGAGRKLYETIDWLIARLSRLVAPVSRDMGAEMVADGLVPAAKLRYFGEGSSNGVNVDRFHRTSETIARGQALRREAGIPDDACVMLFLGRLARDKGVNHLADVLRRVGSDGKTWLVIAGPDDSREPTERSVLETLDACPHVVRLGYQPDPVPLYAAADLLIFPSLREGFSNVTLEAQAMGLPVLGFDIKGVNGPVENGATGLLAPVGDSAALAKNAEKLIADTELRARMSAAAAARVRDHFRNETVWRDLTATLRELAGS